MTETLEIPQLPFGARGRIVAGLVVAGLAAIWIFGVYAYLSLAEVVPVHFGLSGEADAYGKKVTFLILPPAFSIAPLLILLITRYRFTLIRKHPYLLNLPAFFTTLDKLPTEQRSMWINRYFEVVLALAVAVTWFLLALEIGIYEGTVSGKLASWFLPATLLMPVALVVPFLVYLRKLSQEFQTKIEAR